MKQSELIAAILTASATAPKKNRLPDDYIEALADKLGVKADTLREFHDGAIEQHKKRKKRGLPPLPTMFS